MIYPPIDQFVGDYRWLSNFEAVEVELAGVTYDSVEHAYQASKSEDPLTRIRIWSCQTPGEAKRIGKTLKPSKDWESRKLHIMFDLLQQKFNQQPFHSKLLGTGNRAIIEGNTWNDQFWGVYRGEGQNWLGVLIMCIRDKRMPSIPTPVRQGALFDA